MIVYWRMTRSLPPKSPQKFGRRKRGSKHLMPSSQEASMLFAPIFLRFDLPMYVENIAQAMAVASTPVQLRTCRHIDRHPFIDYEA